jgi:hypothetical protein
MMTVSDLIAMLRTLPLDARVVVNGFESGFDDVTGATLQPVVVNGGHRERLSSGIFATRRLNLAVASTKDRMRG